MIKEGEKGFNKWEKQSQHKSKRARIVVGINMVDRSGFYRIFTAHKAIAWGLIVIFIGKMIVQII